MKNRRKIAAIIISFIALALNFPLYYYSLVAWLDIGDVNGCFSNFTIGFICVLISVMHYNVIIDYRRKPFEVEAHHPLIRIWLEMTKVSYLITFVIGCLSFFGISSIPHQSPLLSIDYMWIGGFVGMFFSVIITSKK